MTAYTTQKAAALAQRLAAQQAENERQLAVIRDEQEAHEKKLAGALKTAGPARVAFVEDLLEKFGVGPVEHEERRNKRTGEVLSGKDGTPKTFDPDPDETQRMALLADAIDALLADDGAAADDVVGTPSVVPFPPSHGTSPDAVTGDAGSDGYERETQHVS